MYTLEELKQKIDNDYKGFKISDVRLDSEYVSEFTISKIVGDELFLYVYFWDRKYDSYITYFI